MRVISRRSKSRRQDEDPARTDSPRDPSGASEAPQTPEPPASPSTPDTGLKRPPPTLEPPLSEQPPPAAEEGEPDPDGERGADPAKALGQEGFRDGTSRGPEATTAVLPAVAGSEAAQRRRARAAERQRMAAEVKRSRAARRRGVPYRDVSPAGRAADQHRSSMLVMVLTLGLLIAAVAVTGAMIASSMRTQPVTLASPLHIYPVTQTTPGQCPTGTQGITGQTGSGPACYRMAQGIAIHKVADLRVQKSRVKPGGYDVAVTLRPVDRDAFAELTRATVGRDLAFVVKNRIVTLPRVDMAILDGKVVVTGPPDRTSATRLVRELKGR
ncbi:MULTISPECIES: SecDF P1 head subdomain-containing protein [unclassified Spirillospora]|uniref:SecDF P1 head subdomain-containing protein n=1 Tax=unclassified Spirillospora TaxID=2642701 RepID=UPI00371DBB2E